MTTMPSRSFPSLPVSRALPSTAGFQKSQSNRFVFELVDTPEFRAWFASTFAAWLKSHFSSPEQVAAAFGKRYQTAVNWWNAENMASGDTVGIVFMTFPHAVDYFLAAWEART